ncbi:hypothetical protein P4O66_014199, partial [Electrophorus voltai]
MSPSSVLSSLILPAFWSPVVCSSYTVMEVAVNEAAVLPCGAACRTDARWIRFLPEEATVALCVGGTCGVQRDFQKRFQLLENSTQGNISLLIRSAAYNDIGSYRCSCGGRTSEVKLKVFVPTVVMVREQENITLPCYGDTRRDARDAQWVKEGRRVLLYDRVTGTVTHGRGFDDRFMLSPDGFTDGDLSLHVRLVHKLDEGLYQCTINDESREGEPRAVLLRV